MPSSDLKTWIMCLHFRTRYRAQSAGSRAQLSRRPQHTRSGSNSNTHRSVRPLGLECASVAGIVATPTSAPVAGRHRPRPAVHAVVAMVATAEAVTAGWQRRSRRWWRQRR
eukprot:1262675-Prymnesium_polylepis.1